LSGALDLVCGPYLQNSSLAWACDRRYYLDLVWEEASLELAELLTEAGRMTEARDRCEQTLAVNPYSEPVYRLLLRIERYSGTPSSAMAVYRRAIAALKEIGLEPGPQIRDELGFTLSSPIR
jgi:DNA-binding SARP family transcriptional activator